MFFGNSFSRSILIGLMIFSMTFGAGNVVAPLAAGYFTGSNYLYAILGFFFTSVFFPMAGFFAVMLSHGDYSLLLKKISFGQEEPSLFLKAFQSGFAFFLTLISMLLLGPVGCIPRCVVFARESIGISSFLFNISFFIVCFLLASKKRNLLSIIGKIVAPVTIASIFVFIIRGIFFPSSTELVAMNPLKAFGSGLFFGSQTLDLLAMIFYSRVVYQVVSDEFKQEDYPFEKVLKTLFISSVWSSIIFSIIYGGLIFIAAKHSSGFSGEVSQAQLFTAYAHLLLGKFAFLQQFVIVAACLSTTTALLAVFADYVAVNILKKDSYLLCLIGSSLVGLLISNYSFVMIQKIMFTLIMATFPFLSLLVLIVSLRYFCCYK